jgi:hypothetical protein
MDTITRYLLSDLCRQEGIWQLAAPVIIQLKSGMYSLDIVYALSQTHIQTGFERSHRVMMVHGI